ncbi:YidB family protein [Methyloligella sp. 2.7D]|uniref:YidB family protein n=1 Tax=unclassified Methyloligella TaxID=2625955 RepID=UPI00157DAB59|nr:YidB family protein [Methyloligella sp. GL2]QKP76913.1 DUF937 domain-containing protein [Methyloligella sp. GL2]
MGLFDDAVPGGNITKPLMIAVGALLIGKMLTGGENDFGAPKDDGAAPETAPPQVDTTAAAEGGLFGGLGGLLETLSKGGLQSTVDSWVQTGENEPVAPGSLKDALGSTTISDLARQAGIDEQDLLNQLATVLPGLIDKMTPGGKVPNQTELDSFFKS